LGVSPYSQRSSQNWTRFPLPIIMVVQALKSAFSTTEYDSGICDHGLEESVHLYHCQRILKALLKFCNSRTLSPPSFFGLCTLLQLTRQLPLLTSSLPCHRNPPLILSIFLMTHLDRGNTVMWYNTTDDRTEFTKISLLDLFKSFPFHLGSFPATLSTKTCSSSFRILLSRKGSPKYLQGRLPCFTCICSTIHEMSRPSHLNGNTSDLCVFARKPVASPKWTSSFRRFATSEEVGHINSITSSA
jgi:hypothetical protein